MIPPPPRSTLFPYTTLFRSVMGQPPVICGIFAWRVRSWGEAGDRKSTRLNSSHLGISYAVFCLKKKKQEERLGVLDMCMTKYGRPRGRTETCRNSDATRPG